MRAQRGGARLAQRPGQAVCRTCERCRLRAHTAAGHPHVATAASRRSRGGRRQEWRQARCRWGQGAGTGRLRPALQQMPAHRARRPARHPGLLHPAAGCRSRRHKAGRGGGAARRSMQAALASNLSRTRLPQRRCTPRTPAAHFRPPGGGQEAGVESAGRRRVTRRPGAAAEPLSSARRVQSVGAKSKRILQSTALPWWRRL